MEYVEDLLMEVERLTERRKVAELSCLGLSF